MAYRLHRMQLQTRVIIFLFTAVLLQRNILTTAFVHRYVSVAPIHVACRTIRCVTVGSTDKPVCCKTRRIQITKWQFLQ